MTPGQRQGSHSGSDKSKNITLESLIQGFPSESRKKETRTIHCTIRCIFNKVGILM